MAVNTSESQIQMEDQEHVSMELTIFGTELNLLPPDLRSRAVDLASCIDGVEAKVTAFASRVRYRYKSSNRAFYEAIPRYLQDIARDNVAAVREERRSLAMAEKERVDAFLRGAMVGEERVNESPWSESPLAVRYGTDFPALTNDMSPEVIEGVWEERHHSIRERCLQLKRFEDWLVDMDARIKPLNSMARLLDRNMPAPKLGSGDSASTKQLRVCISKCRLLATQYRLFMDYSKLIEKFLRERNKTVLSALQYLTDFSELP